MGVQDLLFWFFSAAMLLCGVLVIANRNPVNSAMFLILLFINMAGLFLLLEAFFLAIVQILVYAGAVMVLFLFVIMLLDIKEGARKPVKKLAVGLAAAVGLALSAEIWLAIQGPAAPAGAPLHGGLKEVVKQLFTNYLLPFEVTALILLVAMLGVVLLSRGREVK
ncbi:MAG: NADH-quinone oxidoreductase subunit J [Candidatus Handelsmanbacteria bacterium]|nr:NADH-quinone oxidoreductase subunit J [Candidatus Handelsmanbacteria bacterium]